MNIFPFDPCPQKSAQALDDKRLRRVFQEACMMQSNVQRITHGAGPYGRVPVPRPIAEWLGLLLEAPEAANVSMARQWLYDWVHELAAECLVRFGNTRRWVTTQKYLQLCPRYERVSCEELVFCNMARSGAKGLDYSHIYDAHLAYRAYVGHQWRYVDTRPVTWTKRGPPDWFEELTR